jgi:ubiquinone/menaquinone biosynthesis C-methylase UbiE
MNIPAESFKTKDASSYDSVTAEFDRFTERFSKPLALRVIALARLMPGERVLDVATGTGIVACQAAINVGPTGTVMGIDLSDSMLAAAQAKANRAGLNDQVGFRKMDAEALAFKKESFDAVLCLFALLHFPNPLVALREMLRVLRPGGKLVLASGSGPPWISLRGLAHRAQRVAELLLELQGKRLLAPAFLNSLVEQHIPHNGEAEETALARTAQNRTRTIPPLVREAGFVRVRCFWECYRARVETPEEFWDLQRTFSSIARKRLSKADSNEVAILKQEFLRRCCEVQSRGGRLVYPSAAFFIVAQRPT